jgi:ligand-binding SRPBCC domain-containing protein
MSIFELHRCQWVPHPLQEVFQFFSAAENLERLTPPFLKFRIEHAPARLDAGSQIQYKLRVHGLPMRWLTTIERWDPPSLFVDVQTRGPYKLWQHTHRFKSENGGTSIEDHLRYSLPLGILCRIAHRITVRRDVETIFNYREQRIRELFPSATKTLTSTD